MMHKGVAKEQMKGRLFLLHCGSWLEVELSTCRGSPTNDGVGEGTGTSSQRRLGANLLETTATEKMLEGRTGDDCQ